MCSEVLEVIITSILQVFDQKNHFFEEWSWFKFNYLELALGMVLKFYTSVVKRLKLKYRKFWGVIPMFVEVTGEKRKTGMGPFCPPPPPPKSLIGLKLNLFQFITLIPKKKGSFSEKQKCLIRILDCYNVKLNTGTLPDLRWSSFRQQLPIGS